MRNLTNKSVDSAAVTVAAADAVTATVTTPALTNLTVETAAMKAQDNSNNAAATVNAPANHPVWDLKPIISTMRGMTSTTLTDYLAAHEGYLNDSIASGQVAPLVARMLQKGFARVLTESCTLYNGLTTDTAKLEHLATLWTYLEHDCLTKSAYVAATRPAPEPKPAKAPRAASQSGMMALSETITAMSLSVDVPVDSRAAYAKIAAALALPTGKTMYATLMTMPKAAAIIAEAEAIMTAAAAARAEAKAAAEAAAAETMANELADMFG
jgi:hypothetical protein